jgi:hypothetical protein
MASVVLCASVVTFQLQRLSSVASASGVFAYNCRVDRGEADAVVLAEEFLMLTFSDTHAISEDESLCCLAKACDIVWC